MRAVRWSAVAVGVAAVALLGGCGDDGDDEEATVTTAPPAATETTVDPIGENPDFDTCADVYIEALEQLDLTGIDPAGGYDDAELQLVDQRLVALEVAYPAMADDGVCASVIDGATEEQALALAARIDPTVLEILTAPASQEFEPIGEEING